MSLGIRHDRGIDETKVEVTEPGIDLGCTPYQARSHEIHGMFSFGYRTQERDRCRAVDPHPQQLVHLNNDRVQNDELPPQLSHQRGSQIVRVVPSIRRGDNGSGVGQNLQSLEANSRR